jgi:hypothetical protein
MTPLNKSFVGASNTKRVNLNTILIRSKIDKIVYPSFHLVERMVERNVDPLDIARMTVPLVKYFRETTFNDKSCLVMWRDLKLVAVIKIGSVSGKRSIVLKTIIDDVSRKTFDETFKVE